MVPTSLIMVILAAAFFSSSFNYFCRFPHRRIVNMHSLLMSGTGVVMVFTVTLAIVGVQIVWLSWVLLATAIGWFIASMRLFRTALAAIRARDRALAERLARGH
jgi:hypothetical protein